MPTAFITVPLADALKVAASGVLVFAAVILCVRVLGLRTFSKMTSTDFAVTIAVGAIIASTILSPSTPILQGLVGVVTLLGVQALVAVAVRNPRFRSVIENSPKVLMVNGEMLDDAMKESRVAVSELRSKLREANVLQLSEVQVVILETTGDISVMHGDQPVDPELLEGVRYAERYSTS